MCKRGVSLYLALHTYIIKVHHPKGEILGDKVSTPWDLSQCNEFAHLGLGEVSERKSLTASLSLRTLAVMKGRKSSGSSCCSPNKFN